MKTLISQTKNSAVYELSYDGNSKTIEITSMEDGADFEKAADKEHTNWLKWLGVTE
jgi:YD repeat-containing protein